MGTGMRAVQVARALRKLALPAGAARGSHVLGPQRLAPVLCQQTSVVRCRRGASTESFAWSVGSEPGSSTGAPAGSGAHADGATPGASAGAGGKQSSDKESAHEEEIVDEKTQVLRAAMTHVSKLGWTEAALVEGAKDARLSPAIVGAFPRKEAALVEFFMEECNRHLEDEAEAREKELSSMLLAERIAQIVRLRLQMQIPFLSKWPQALSIQAHPMNAATALTQRAVLIDDIWHAAGDRSTDMDWYAKRAVLGGVYTATELYLLTDYSPGHRDTWAFLERRIKDAVDCRKTAQEASHLAQAVRMGLSNSVSSLFSKGFGSQKF